MTLRLILTRHAKSAWDDPLLTDHDRILNARGRDAADRIGDWLRRQGYVPDAALVSSALRARETWDRIAARLGNAPEPVICPDLYHCGSDRMLERLRAAPAVGCVLMLGHNPGIARLADELLSRRPSHPRFSGYPTAATLVADFPAQGWPDIRPGTAEEVAFVIPRELPAAEPG